MGQNAVQDVFEALVENTKMQKNCQTDWPGQ